jgi:hypothetical protein
MAMRSEQGWDTFAAALCLGLKLQLEFGLGLVAWLARPSVALTHVGKEAPNVVGRQLTLPAQEIRCGWDGCNGAVRELGSRQHSIHSIHPNVAMRYIECCYEIHRMLL